MFEDFENRSGFWKDLGSNFTINYAGDAPSFLSSGEMWATMDGSETQTLAAWENGWVLTNNPDGTMTATPKYTSGLISQTLVRVPVGPQTPMSSPTGGVGGVQVAFSADEATLLTGWKKDPENWTLKSINENCPDIGADEVCNGSPFSQFTIRGDMGTKMDDERWWWKSNDILGLSNYDGGSDKSGACEIDIREGYMVKLKVKFETEGEYDFMSDIFSQITEDDVGIIDTTSDSFTALMKGGDKLSVDIDNDWSGTARFYLKCQGQEYGYAKDGNAIDDEVYIELKEVYIPDDSTPNGGGGSGGTGGGTGGGSNGGSNNGGSNGGSNGDDNQDDTTNGDEGVMGGFGTVGIIGAIAVIGYLVLNR